MNTQTEDYSNLEELNNVFSKKVSLLRECLQLRCIDKSDANYLHNVQSGLADVRSLCQEIRLEIKAGKDKLKEMQNLLKKTEILNQKLDHMIGNIPSVLQKETIIPKEVKIPEVNKIDNTPCNGGKKVRVPPKIQYLTLSEYESIPKYMKGRLQYLQINNFIDSFNKTTAEKYKLLSMPRKTLKPAALKSCQLLKAQENEETKTKGLYFCTLDNMKEYANIKMDKMSTNLLTILRHCSRTKEIRGPGPIIRYVVQV